MTIRTPLHFRSLFLVTAFLAATACGGGATSPTPTEPVRSVALSQTAATLAPAQSVTLTATTKDGNGNVLTGRVVTWSTSVPAVATVNGGLVTAVAAGTTVVSATSEGQVASATITVAETVVPVATVSLNQGSATLVSGQTLALIATPKDASGNALTGRGVTWSSSNTAVAGVDGNGVVTPLSVGTTTITATSEGKSATAAITVNNGAQVGPLGGTATGFSGNASVVVPAGALSSPLIITIAQVSNPQADLKLAPGTAYDFGPTGTTFTAPVTLNIKYDPATLPAGTNQAQLRVHKLVGTTWTPLAGSSVNITTHVVSGNTSSFSTYAILEVPVSIASVTVTPAPVDLPLGMQVQLTATVKDAQGNVLTGRTVTWTSSTQTTATVGVTTGLVTSAAIGTTTITATSEGITGTAPVAVRSDPSARTMALNTGAGFTFVTGRGLVVIPNVSTNASCAIGADQKARCWGSNGNGAIGDGTLLDRSVPTPIALSAPLVAVTSGGGFNCALDTSHNAWCWGFNGYGQFGNGSFTVDQPTPVSAGSARKFTDLAAGESHLCGIDVGGGTYCWGRNDLGNLGIGFVSPASAIVVGTPTRITNDPGLVSISAGNYANCGLTVTGAAYCWGSTGPSTPPATAATPVPGGLSFSRISTGADHSCALTMDRHLYCWGQNLYGQLGDGTTNAHASPALVAGTNTWRFVAAGSGYTCAITVDGRTFCWGLQTGFANDGQIGNGTSGGVLVPTQISATVPPLAVVATGYSHTCGITVDGTAYCWGFRGELGDGDYAYSAAPSAVVNASGAQGVARGANLGCYITATKFVNCWGETEDQTSAQLPSIGPVQVKSISASETGYACVILDATAVVGCWGANDHSQLGNGSSASGTSSVLTVIANSKSFTSVAAGLNVACGITTTKELDCWGNDVSTPQAIMPSNTWAFVAPAAFTKMCAVTDTGSAYCGTPGPSMAIIPGSQHWVSMVGGGDPGAPIYCGVTDANDAYCMGYNFNGAVGDGSNTNRSTMTLVSGGLKFSQVVMAGQTTCGLTLAGAAYCWGSGSSGQFGIAPAISANVPTAVPGGLQFSKLSMSSGGVCGQTTTGAVYCWGTRYLSALGNGARDDRLLPVQVTTSTRFLIYEPGSAALRALLRAGKN